MLEVSIWLLVCITPPTVTLTILVLLDKLKESKRDRQQYIKYVNAYNPLTAKIEKTPKVAVKVLATAKDEPADWYRRNGVTPQDYQAYGWMEA
jgi:hypothetical protein